MDIKELFKILVKAYYEDNFETVVNNLMEQNENKDFINKVISALCGVDLSDNSNEYSKELKNAIFNYVSTNKVVVRVKDCNFDCMNLGEKTNCEESCAFDAILIKDKRVFIDSNKCTDCGFCIDACPNNCYMDKVEFLPLAKTLNEKRLSF